MTEQEKFQEGLDKLMSNGWSWRGGSSANNSPSIPSDMNAYQQLVTDYDGKMRWIDTMEYAELAEEVPENTFRCTISAGANYANGIVWTSPTIAQAGEIRVVEFDGIKYRCVAQDRSGSIALGNLAIRNEGDDTGEPFLWLFSPNGRPGYRSSLATKDAVPTTHTIKTYVETLHPNESDNGKFLRVVEGEPKWAEVPNAEGASF